MLIRPEQTADLPRIQAVHCACFPTDAEARLVDLLRDAGRLSVSLIAETDGAIIGHIAFSPVTTATGAIGAALAPLAVMTSHRRRGIGGRLILDGLADCRAAGFGWAVVIGDPAYYERFGFRPAGEFGLVDEYGGGAAFQAMELSAGRIPIGAGLIRYAPEFAEIE